MRIKNIEDKFIKEGYKVFYTPAFLGRPRFGVRKGLRIELHKSARQAYLAHFS